MVELVHEVKGVGRLFVVRVLAEGGAWKSTVTAVVLVLAPDVEKAVEKALEYVRKEHPSSASVRGLSADVGWVVV